MAFDVDALPGALFHPAVRKLETGPDGEMEAAMEAAMAKSRTPFGYVAALAGALFAGWTANPSAAQPPHGPGQMICGERAKIVAGLARDYSEKPVSMGLANQGAIVEVLASDSGTFTIITTLPSGLSCLVASGSYWENLPARLAGTKM